MHASVSHLILPVRVQPERRRGAGRERIKWIFLLVPQFLHYSLIYVLILQSHHLYVRGKAGKEVERE